MLDKSDPVFSAVMVESSSRGCPEAQVKGNNNYIVPRPHCWFRALCALAFARAVELLLRPDTGLSTLNFRDFKIRDMYVVPTGSIFR
eukprot:SAG31_NODE_1905_length_6952_cov_4.685685_1_plen_87_part_00